MPYFRDNRFTLNKEFAIKRANDLEAVKSHLRPSQLRAAQIVVAWVERGGPEPTQAIELVTAAHAELKRLHLLP